jgi:pimeloyl-ACP methyl ester carboxylesterase
VKVPYPTDEGVARLEQGGSATMQMDYRRRLVAFLVLYLGSAAVLAADAVDLPRKAGSGDQREAYPGVIVNYDAIHDAAGHRLRFIVTHPQHSETRVPVIFVVGWLSCDTVEAPPGASGAPQRVFQSLAVLPGFATARLEKAGVGDSEGDCAKTDFNSELTSYQKAFRKLGDYPFIDGTRIFVFGLSNGGGFAPLVAANAAVRGYVVVGGWLKTWFEHMLEIERRRLILSGHRPTELDQLMKGVEDLYSAYLLRRERPQEIFKNRPDLKALWDGDSTQQYGRPIAYYQQLQDLDLMAAWSSVKVPLLALHGEFDWIMSRSDLESMVELVNHNTPGAAEFLELPATGHTLEHYASQAAAYEGMALPFNNDIASRIGEWFERHR